MIEILNSPQAKAIVVNFTHDPESLVATVAQTYDHQISEHLVADQAAIRFYLRELQRTALKGPLEFVHVVVLFKDVTRAFTHQLVRYRIGASYVQESLRFSPLGAADVGKPLRILCPAHIGAVRKRRERFAAQALACAKAYLHLVKVGVPRQDARNILPIGVLTNIWACFSFTTLMHIWQQRMCYQAQEGEWQLVLRAIKDQIRGIHTAFGDMLELQCEKTGHCPFGSRLDRPCPHRRENDVRSTT